MEEIDPTSRTSSGAKFRWLFLLLAAAVLIAVLRLFPVQAWLRTSITWIEAVGFWGPVLFILLYAVACVLMIPASLLTLGAGAVFGIGKGIILVWIASTLGATLAFFTGRFLARDWVAKLLAKNDRFQGLDAAVAREGWKIVGLTRLSPVFPFTLLNYAFGLTRVSARDYVLASGIGMLPGTVMYVYLGSLGSVVSGRTKFTVAQWLFYAIGLAATITVTVLITTLAKRSLSAKIPCQESQKP